MEALVELSWQTNIAPRQCEMPPFFPEHGVFVAAAGEAARTTIKARMVRNASFSRDGRKMLSDAKTRICGSRGRRGSTRRMLFANRPLRDPHRRVASWQSQRGFR
ncbi:hypothetical protein [Xanthobacter autotrophicus]|uniref:hypothetical protein n=1 Tax=Xanthobacter autotrophicus TaxID=280 RepID=UPI00372CB42B